MGLRGPAPKQKLRSEPLSDLNPPEWLSEEAAAHYRKHAEQLVDNQLLTVQTQDSYAIYCDLYARLRSFAGQSTSRIFLDTLASYTRLASLFRMVPNEKPNVKEDRHKEYPEFVIEKR